MIDRLREVGVKGYFYLAQDCFFLAQGCFYLAQGCFYLAQGCFSQLRAVVTWLGAINLAAFYLECTMGL